MWESLYVLSYDPAFLRRLRRAVGLLALAVTIGWLVSCTVLGIMYRIPPVYGFDDFTHAGVHYDNPSGDIALSMGGSVVEVDWDAVEGLQLRGPGLGIGLAVGIDGAYVNGSAFGLRSLATDGPDARDYECGHLYARLLETHPCSLFVHVPSEPTSWDLAVVRQAVTKIQECQLVMRR